MPRLCREHQGRNDTGAFSREPSGFRGGNKLWTPQKHPSPRPGTNWSPRSARGSHRRWTATVSDYSNPLRSPTRPLTLVHIGTRPRSALAVPPRARIVVNLSTKREKVGLTDLEPHPAASSTFPRGADIQ